jgi:hypothetical protein
MLAFWKRIRVRHAEESSSSSASASASASLPGGAARPFPIANTTKTCCLKWAEDLTRQVVVVLADADRSCTTATTATSPSCVPVEPIAVSHVFESVSDGQPWSRQLGIPAYEQVFQGI